MTTPAPARTERVEGLVLVTILLLVAGFAGAASFTHVHDWTMHNTPTGTPAGSAGQTPSSPNSSQWPRC